MSSRREQILDAALHTFTEKGFTAATIDDIRRHSGASTGSMYHHFGGKEGLAADLYQEGLERYQEGLLEALRRTAGAEARVRGVIRHHLRWTAQNPDLARFVFTRRESEVRAITQERLQESNRRFFAEVSELLEPMFAGGELRRMPFDLFNAVLIGPSQEFAHHWLAGRARTSMRAAERTLADAAWQSVRGRPGSE